MQLTEKNEHSAGIYLHIPFCRQACVYCNFHFSTSLRYKEDVLAAMMQELVMQKAYLAGRSISTIYFGGGTPSLLTADEINRLIDTIQQHYKVENLAECTLEANPDDLSREHLRALRHTPISRFSIGVQSFRDEDLQYMKRAHNAQQADTAIKGAQDAGFENLTIDLIYGIPGLNDKAWKGNLNKVAELAIPHFSAYALTVEERTALHHAIATNKAAPVDNEQAAAQLMILMEHAAGMGYEHYEISNLARPGMYAIHNTNYWRGLPYLGIGPSAHSFDGHNRRHWNVANNIRYTEAILKHNTLQKEEEVLSHRDRVNEYIMTSLRTQWGCDLNHIAQEWDDTTAAITAKAAELFQEKKWLYEQDRKLILTNNGKLFADRIAAELFLPSGND